MVSKSTKIDSNLYARKMNEEFDENNLTNKKFKRLRRLFRSLKRKKTLKILAIVGVALGVGIVIYSHPANRKLVIGCISKVRGFFTSSDETTSSKVVPEAFNKSNKNYNNLQKIGILGLAAGAAVCAIIVKNNKKEVIVEAPSSFNTSTNECEWRIIAGVLIHFAGLFTSAVATSTIWYCIPVYKFGIGLQIAGWQMATAPCYH